MEVTDQSTYPENRTNPNSFNRATLDFTTDLSGIYSIKCVAFPDCPDSRMKVASLHLMEKQKQKASDKWPLDALDSASSKMALQNSASDIPRRSLLCEQYTEIASYSMVLSEGQHTAAAGAENISWDLQCPLALLI